MRQRPSLRCALLIVATAVAASAIAAAAAHAGPVPVLPSCASGTGPVCAGSSAGRGPLLRADWLDDLFGISLPPGPWRQSCRKARVDGHYLVAECRRKSGAYRDTTFDLRRCGGDIAYAGGKFHCARGERGAGERTNTMKPVDPGKN